MAVEYVVVMCRDGHCNAHPAGVVTLAPGTSTIEEARRQLEAEGWQYQSSRERPGLDVLIVRRDGSAAEVDLRQMVDVSDELSEERSSGT